MITMLIDVIDDVKSFMEREASAYKNILYAKSFKGKEFFTISIIEEGDITYYCESSVIIMKSKQSYYFRPMNKRGFTIDKGKFKLWFGTTSKSLSLDIIFKHYKIDWIDKSLYPILSPSILGSVITGKITNPTDVAKKYLSYIRCKDVSHKLYLQCLDKKLNPSFLFKIMNVSTDKNHALEYILGNNYYNILKDTVEQAEVLDYKIDFKWSALRIKEEHKKLTNMIMDIEAEYIEDVNLYYELPEYPKEFTLLKTIKDVYREGKSMNHCLYTNYARQMINGSYAAFHVTLNDEEATLGLCRGWNNRWEYSQCYSYGNKSISNEMKMFVNDYCMKLSNSLSGCKVLLE